MLFPLVTAVRSLPVQEASSSLLEPSAWEGVARTSVEWIGVAIVAWLSNVLARRMGVRGMRALAAKTRTKTDDILVQHGVFMRLSHLAPALVLYVAAPLLFDDPEQIVFRNAMRRLAHVWMIVAGARFLTALIDALVAIARTDPAARNKPLRSYAQVAQIILWIAASILAVAVIMDKSPSALLTGLGAMTAVIMLVFRDTILGFIASLRISQNDMLQVGDWIEMPQFGADGDVLDIGVHTVKVQNWDKSITTIPTHSLIDGSFKNWRGMSESGGRRIKRSLCLDMSSVRFLAAEDVERLREISVLRPYLEEREREIAQWNEEARGEGASPANGRALTNLGTFRAYVDTYVRGLQTINKDMTLLVRQLAPTPEGLPIEIYCFSADKRWAHYETIMADIFDHLLAVIAEFDLRVFQQSTSHDVRQLAEAARHRP